MTYRLFAVTAPGLEEITRAELVGLGFTPSAAQAGSSAQEETGGVEFDARPADMFRANLQLRTASRVLARMGEFDAVGFEEFRKKAARLPWQEFMRPGQQVQIRVTCHKSRLYHSSAVGRELVAAISSAVRGDVIPAKPQEDEPTPPQLIVVRLVNDHCTFSIDSSGELLHRRGYRLQTAKAPLRETLAAALLLASGWDASSPLVDPFCGSGTIPIEAALMASHTAPGLNRRFAFQDWPNLKPALWTEQLEAARAAVTPGEVVIHGSDRDEGAIAICAENARRAGVENMIQFSHAAFSAVEAPTGPGWMVTNPPYGIRVSSTNDLRNLYTRLGDVLRAQFHGWHYGILCADPVLAGHTRLQTDEVRAMVNGGIQVKFFTGQVDK
jgi:putative N6-adenine-specific DNA methylase